MKPMVRYAWLLLPLMTIISLSSTARASQDAVAASVEQTEDDTLAGMEPPAREDATMLETLVVSGRMPGPGMWKVSRDGHVMWILGTLQPVARRMEWDSAEVAERVASVDAILFPPTVKFDLGIGKLRQLMLMPALMGARKNPEGDRLVEHVSAEDYARWLELKARYLRRDRAVEKRRPLFASQELYSAAIKKSGLEYRGLVSPLVRKIAKKNGIPIERPKIEIAIADARGAIRDFRAGAIDDAECFGKTLDHLETDLGNMRLRANAWARGDMLTLRELSYVDFGRVCMDSFLESRFAKEQGIDDLPERLEVLWLESVEETLKQHRSSFTVGSIGGLVGEDGLLAKLAARGYQVEEP